MKLIKRYLRVIGVKFGWIKDGDRLWYYYLPSDQFVNTKINKDKPHDVIKRGKWYYVKHKDWDILRKSTYPRVSDAQKMVDLEYLIYKSF